MSAPRHLHRELYAEHPVKLFVIWKDDGLTKNQQVEHLLAVCLHDNCAVIKISLLFFCLLCQNVTVISVLTLDLSCAGKLETLFGS